jgi:cell shape-determining protein MreC
MRSFQFNHVFAGLMGVALLSAFVLPKPLSDRARAQVQVIFGVVTSPLRSAADSVAKRFRPAERVDVASPAGAPRAYREIAEENRQLRAALAALVTQFQQLKNVDEERASLGPLRQSSRAMKVVSSDAGLRRSLSVQGSVTDLRPGMAAIYAGALVGRLDRVAWAGSAQVQLVTDRGFRASVHFGHQQRNEAGQSEFVPVGKLSGLIEGNGQDGMTVRHISMKDVSESGLVVGDWAVLYDTDYPLVLQGYQVGEVTQIAPSRTILLFAEIQIRPVRNLQTLHEVMILVK